ncbi:MAG: hypothetical protein IKZ49_02750, partial [Alphaproteobacteria bacterium]|nr:hypothetical protein [Alphaproteobacteria bacterium]
MRKSIFILFVTIFTITEAGAVNNYVPKKFNTVTSHDDVYPYRLNNTKTNTNAKDISAASTARRAVVPRSNAVRVTPAAQPQQPRRVVQRTNTNARMVRSAAPSANTNYRATSAPVRVRSTSRVRNTTTDNYYTTAERPSSQRCMADYKECMEG